MRLRLIWIGKTRDKHLNALIDEYVVRTKRFAACDVVELKEAKTAASAGQEQRILESEADSILGALSRDSFAVLLDIGGAQLSSPQLADLISRKQTEGAKELGFIIGGHLGVSDRVRARANLRWSLSPLTLTHDMARVLVAEQIYRAFTILHNLPYQR